MRWAEISGKNTNVRLPDFDFIIGRGERCYFTESDYNQSDYLRWAVQQGQVTLRWVMELPQDANIPPHYKRLRASRGASQAGTAPMSPDVGGLLAQLLVKADAAREEQKDLLVAVLARQDALATSIQNLNDRLTVLESVRLPEFPEVDLSKIGSLVEGNGELIRSVLQSLETIRISGSGSISKAVSSGTGDDMPIFIPKSEPGQVGEVSLDIEEQSSDADVGDALAALRKFKKKQK